MMNRLLPATLPLLLSGCPSAQNKQPADQAAAPPAPTPAASAEPSSPGAAYRLYRGVLAGRPDTLTLHLLQTTNDRTGNAGEFVNDLNVRYYGADGEPHDVYQAGGRHAADSLVLSEDLPGARTPDGGPRTVSWRLRRQPDGSLGGTRDGQALTLRPARPAVAFAVRVFADSVAAFPKKPKTPYAHLRLQTLVPYGAGVPATLGPSIWRVQRGDTLPNRPPTPTPASLWHDGQAQYIKGYREGVADLMTDAPQGDDMSYALRWEVNRTVSVVCQQGRLLSLGYLYYGYSGGAHGNYGTTVRSFDLRTGQPLFFQDIFRPGAETALLPLLDRGVRRTLGIQPTERLDSQLLVEKMALTRNVCLTPGGALFVYAPYEIASYAQGEIRVFVPLAELRPLLREGLPLPGASASVAVR